jgi:hypothetical protein
MVVADMAAHNALDGFRLDRRVWQASVPGVRQDQRALRPNRAALCHQAGSRQNHDLILIEQVRRAGVKQMEGQVMQRAVWHDRELLVAGDPSRKRLDQRRVKPL